MEEEQVIISAGGYNLIFIEYFVKRYNSIFKQNHFREVEAFNLYRTLSSSPKNPFRCLEFLGKCQIRLDVYDKYCRIFMEKAFGDKSILPRNIIYFNEITIVRDAVQRDGFERTFSGQRRIPLKKR